MDLIPFSLSNTDNSKELVSRMYRALDIARQSGSKQRHGALLMQGSRTLAIGINVYKNDPRQMIYPDNMINPSGISVHAEVAATKLHRHVPKTTLYLARIGKNGQFYPSDPCPRCIEWLTWHTNVQEVIYS